MEDGRKSFRAISREINVSTPTVKSRYERLVNIGLIKSVKPEIDLSKVHRGKKSKFFGKETIKQLKEQKKHFHVKERIYEGKDAMRKLWRYPQIASLKYLSLQIFSDFSVCIGCKNNYRDKYSGRIRSIVEKSQRDAKRDEKIP